MLFLYFAIELHQLLKKLPLLVWHFVFVIYDEQNVVLYLLEV